MRKFILAAAVILFAGPAAAAVVISSSVSYFNGLYTYNYAIDNSNGSIPVDELAIIVARPPNQPDLTPLPPSSFTSPTGWSFVVGVGGSDPVHGGVWEWQAIRTAQSVQAGATLTGFSFTTNAAPTTSPLENYFLLSDRFDRIQIGTISAPDVALAHPVPEPATWAMLLIGFAGIGTIAYRRRNRLAGRMSAA